jgi:hypothetical protein
MDSSDDSNKSFLKHVFNFDDDSKSDILNIIQYGLVAIVPVVILNKTMSKYIPEADKNKSSLEISAEVIIQVLIMFIGLLLIHRIITFIPTYSGAKYPEFNVVYIILAMLMITLSLQTKIGEKVTILVDRVNELWNGKPDKKVVGKGGAIKVSQPISGQQTATPSQQMGGYTDGTSISSLPTYEEASGSSQQLPNYNAMYRQDSTPLVNAATPGMESIGVMEPMAANSVLGGGSFGNW